MLILTLLILAVHRIPACISCLPSCTCSCAKSNGSSKRWAKLRLKRRWTACCCSHSVEDARKSSMPGYIASSFSMKTTLAENQRAGPPCIATQPRRVPKGQQTPFDAAPQSRGCSNPGNNRSYIALNRAHVELSDSSSATVELAQHPPASSRKKSIPPQRPSNKRQNRHNTGKFFSKLSATLSCIGDVA